MSSANTKTVWGKSLRYRRRRIWLVPTLWVVLAIVMGVILSRAHLPGLAAEFTTPLTPDVVAPVLSSIASGMMALTAIVFSLAFVFVQFGSSAYSPRLVSLFTRDRVVTHSLGIFTGTFLFALVGLMLLTPDRPPLMTWAVAVVSMIWLLASVALFILLIRRINTLTISNVLHMVGERGRRVIEEMYPPLDSYPLTPGQGDVTAPQSPAPLPSVTQTLRYLGGPAVVIELHIQELVELARRADAVIEIAYAVGDVVMDGSDVLYVRAGREKISETALQQAIALGFERTIEQDPKYALRLLVDVGIKALSPAVNDPTTAVMALNEIADLVGRIGRRRLDVGYAQDESGALRLVYPTPTWADFLSLAIDEIRFYGANSYQVMRRLRAMLADLEQIVPAERRTALRPQVNRMEEAIERTFEDTSDMLEARQTDRQGIGLSRASTSHTTESAT
jgi:uncharacterized membrane protein